MSRVNRQAGDHKSMRPAVSQSQSPAGNGAAPAPQLWRGRSALDQRNTNIRVAGIAHHDWEGDQGKDRPTWYMARVLHQLSGEILAVLATHAPGAEPSVHLAEALVLASQATKLRVEGPAVGKFTLDLPGLLAEEPLDAGAIAFACGRGLCENYHLLRDHLLPTLAPSDAFRLAEALAVAHKHCGEFNNHGDTDAGAEIEALCYRYYWQVLTSGGAR